MGVLSARALRAAGWFVVIVVGVVIVVAMLTAALRPTSSIPPIMSDALGPDNGQRIDDYVAHAASTLDNPTGERGTPRWALVSYDAARTVPEAAAAIDSAGIGRISQALIYTPVEDVSMPVLSAAVAAPTSEDSGHAAALERAATSAVTNGVYALDHPGTGVPSAGTTGEQMPAQLGDERRRDELGYTASVVDAGGEAIIGLIVRASTDELHSLRSERGVRAVEALPPDAVWGRFAVRPLLPGYTDVVAPLADTGAIPEAAAPGE